MSVYKPNNSSLFVYDFMLGGQRYSGPTGCKTKRDAARVEAKVRAEVALDIGRSKKQPITLDEAAGRYDAYLRSANKWSATADYIMADLVASLGRNRYLSDISQQDLADHFASRAAKVSAATVNREIEVARPIWRRVHKSHDIGEMPEWGQLFYAVAERPPRELSGDEETALFPEIRQDLYDFCDFALRAGWRRSEVLGLRWTDCDLNGATADTRIKGGAIVRRPLTQAMVILIANQPKVGPFVFTYVCRANKSRYVDKRGRVQPASSSTASPAAAAPAPALPRRSAATSTSRSTTAQPRSRSTRRTIPAPSIFARTFARSGRGGDEATAGRRRLVLARLQGIQQGEGRPGQGSPYPRARR
jgi:hypothetical protein